VYSAASGNAPRDSEGQTGEDGDVNASDSPTSSLAAWTVRMCVKDRRVVVEVKVRRKVWSVNQC
jgi:hypothetical protein